MDDANHIARLLDQLAARLLTPGPDYLPRALTHVMNAAAEKVGPAEEAKSLAAALRSAAALASELEQLTGSGAGSCSEDASNDVDGVLISGHTSTCPHGLPRRYTWQYRGELQSGTLADYAKAWAEEWNSKVRGLDTQICAPEKKYWVVMEHVGSFSEEPWRFRLTAENESVVVSVGRLV